MFQKKTCERCGHLRRFVRETLGITGMSSWMLCRRCRRYIYRKTGIR